MKQVPNLEPTILKGMMNFTVIEYFLLEVHELKHILYLKKKKKKKTKKIRKKKWAPL